MLRLLLPCHRFQYSLRIVGFRDMRRCVMKFVVHFRTLSVFPANRGVPRLYTVYYVENPDIFFQYSLRIVGFRDPADSRSTISPYLFQYSLRIVGFRDSGSILFRRIPPAFSIPCESWGSATWR